MRHLVKAVVALLLLFAEFSMAAPSPKNEDNGYAVMARDNDANNGKDKKTDWSKAWASFCKDADCSKDCADWVPVDKPDSAKTEACLDQKDVNGSVKFKDVVMWDFSLVISPKAGCSCQSENLFMADGSGSLKGNCLNLNSHPGGVSYKFVDSTANPTDFCPPNEIPN